MLYTENNSVDECLFKRKVIFAQSKKTYCIEEFQDKVNYENITHFYVVQDVNVPMQKKKRFQQSSWKNNNLTHPFKENKLIWQHGTFWFTCISFCDKKDTELSVLNWIIPVYQADV